ncbi:MAG: Arc family DNA-binding protein [Rhizomicrobium sp.]
MGVNISIKNVPKEKVELLKRRAKSNHRSLQGELMAIIEDAANRAPQSITIEELIERGRRAGLSTSSDSVQMIREDRDR